MKYVFLSIGAIFSVLALITAIDGLVQMRILGTTPLLMTQALLLLIVSSISGLGVLLSLVFPKWIASHLALRKVIIGIVLFMPAIDTLRLIHSEISRAFVFDLLVSGVLSGMISLAIATAWMPRFNNNRQQSANNRIKQSGPNNRDQTIGDRPRLIPTNTTTTKTKQPKQ